MKDQSKCDLKNLEEPGPGLMRFCDSLFDAPIRQEMRWLFTDGESQYRKPEFPSSMGGLTGQSDWSDPSSHMAT